MSYDDNKRSLIFINQSNRLQSYYFGISGGEGDRTPDLVLAKHALSQLSYTPEKNPENLDPGRVELPTLPLSGVRSNQLSYGSSKRI